MKILYIDLTSPTGHKNYNLNLINIMVKIATVDVMLPWKYIDFKKEGININKHYVIDEKFIPEKIRKTCNNQLIGRIRTITQQISLLKKVIKIQHSYDLIFFSSVEIISFSLTSRSFIKPTFFVDHAIYTTEYSKVRRFFWKKINFKVYPIVMECYIKDYIKDNLKIKNKLFLVPHPLPCVSQDVRLNDSKNSNEIIIFGPAISNDDVFLDNLIKKSNFIPNNIKIIVKSKKQNYKNQNLFVYNTHISEEMYTNYLNECDYILIAYPDEYNYRTSGVFFEAVAFQKKVILNLNNTLKDYFLRYSEIIVGFSGYDDFFESLKDLRKKDTYSNTSFEKIQADYSDETIMEALLDVFKKTKIL